MKHIPCIQGSEEWHYLRLGIATASEFSRIITPKKWDLAAGRRSYQMELVTERILGAPLDQVTTAAMQSGHDWEPKARAAYEMLTGVDVEMCGFCSTDDGSVGASPDAFVGDEGSLEIKSPFKPEIHVGYLLNPDSLKDEYWVQVQGQLFVTGRKWTDLISYFMGIPMARVRIEPHQEFQTKLGVALKTFQNEMADLIEVAKGRGVVFRERPQPSPAKDHSQDFLSDEDAERVIASLLDKGEV